MLRYGLAMANRWWAVRGRVASVMLVAIGVIGVLAWPSGPASSLPTGAGSYVEVTPASGPAGSTFTFRGRCEDDGVVAIGARTSLSSASAHYNWWPAVSSYVDGDYEGSFVVPVGLEGDDYQLSVLCDWKGKSLSGGVDHFVVTPAEPSTSAWLEIRSVVGAPPSTLDAVGRCATDGRVATKVTLDVLGEGQAFEEWFHPEPSPDGSFEQRMVLPSTFSGIITVYLSCSDADGYLVNIEETFLVDEPDVLGGEVAREERAAPAQPVAGQANLTG